MKKYLSIFFVTLLFGQDRSHAQASPAEQLAGTIADRMRDSLHLSTSQRTSIYIINLQLHDQKMNVRKERASTPAEWPLLMQRIENTRDSLYHNVITDEQVFDRYKAKKQQFIRAN